MFIKNSNNKKQSESEKYWYIYWFNQQIQHFSLSFGEIFSYAHKNI